MSDKQNDDGPSIKDALEGFAALPSVLDSLEGVRRQMQSMQAEITALRKVSGGDAERPLITWQQARGKQFVKLKEAAYLLGVSEKTIRRLLERDLLKCSSGIRHKQISVQSLEEYGGNTIL